MTIPNVRIESITTYGGEQIENPFYEGNLNEENKLKLEWYEHGLRDAKDFFNELDDYDFKIDGEDVDLWLILKTHPQVVERLKENFALFLEEIRNETVVGMIEGQDE
jgi:hypothetical protein